jgi:SAM-dependent methyltransferase
MLTDGPYPGDDLAYRVTGRRDRDWFLESGQRSVQELKRIVGLTGKTIDDFEDILDFGCGCGRMLIWLGDVAGNIHGTDIDSAAIDWVRECLPYATATVNHALPPLPYEDGSFDLVFNHSVLTHIDEHRQDLWLAELRRVTRPGGSIVLTVHGEAAFATHEDQHRAVNRDPAPDREGLERDGILFLPEGRWEGDFPDWYATTYHATDYVFHHWSKWLTIKAYVREGALSFQDTVLLERPFDDRIDPYRRRTAITPPSPPSVRNRLFRAVRRST